MASKPNMYVRDYIKKQRSEGERHQQKEKDNSRTPSNRKERVTENVLASQKRIEKRNEGKLEHGMQNFKSSSATETKASYLRRKITALKLQTGIANINGLPDELLLEIFQYLNPNELLCCARVCRRWTGLAKDNVLWMKIYRVYARKESGRRNDPPDPDPSYWKTLCITRCKDIRDKQILPMLKKVSSFTGLCANTEKALRKSGVRWLLCFEDHDSVDHVISQSNVYYFSMSVCVRWYALTTPPLHTIKRLKIFSGNPIFFDKNGEAAVNSPCQRSLLFEMDFRWSDWIRSRQPEGGDDIINVHIVPGGLLVASFKDGKSIAFVTANFHSRSLVNRCLMGTSKKMYLPPRHRPILDDIDPRYGLHGYTCTMELRNQRTSFWSEQFRNMYCNSDVSDSFARFVLLDPDNEYDRSAVGKKISFLWKTDVFKGCVQSLCFLDMTLLDERQEPMWCVSTAVSLKDPSNQEVTYAFNGNHFLIEHRDDIGKVVMKLIWDPEEKQYQMVGLELFLSLQYINRWFGTKY